MVITEKISDIGRGFTSPIVFVDPSPYFDYFYVMKRIYKCTKNGKRYRHGILVQQCLPSDYKDRTFIKPGRYRKVKNFAKKMNKLEREENGYQ